MLGASGLGGLAGLAGVSAGSTFSGLAMYLTGANTLLDAVIDEFDLLTRYKIVTPKKEAKSPKADSREVLKEKLKAEYDDVSGVFSISFTDTDPAFAQRVVNYCVGYLQTWFDGLGVNKNKLEKENLEKNIEHTYDGIRSLELETRRLEQSVQRGSVNVPSISLDLSRIQMEWGPSARSTPSLRSSMSCSRWPWPARNRCFRSWSWRKSRTGSRAPAGVCSASLSLLPWVFSPCSWPLC